MVGWASESEQNTEHIVLWRTTVDIVLVLPLSPFQEDHGTGCLDIGLDPAFLSYIVDSLVRWKFTVVYYRV